MNSQPGTLTGSGIRRLPAQRIRGMVRRIKAHDPKLPPVKSVRYRVTGFRNPDTGVWISRNAQNGHYYQIVGGINERHSTRVKPTADHLRRTNMLSLEVEILRHGQREGRIYYLSVPGI